MPKTVLMLSRRPGPRRRLQTRDVHIDGAGAGLAAGPDRGHQLFPGEGALGVQHEVRQQIEFQPWQVELAASEEDRPGRGVDTDLLRPGLVGRRLREAGRFLVEAGARMMWTSSDGSRCTDTGSRSCRVNCHLPSGSRSTARVALRRARL